ncbi:hypothetical protein LY76DRAFT_324221 [Colletotrichum caudatum]|nr:hypothetical protein LY76DRAFT_324221 [Colletotrichum caudatum]
MEAITVPFFPQSLSVCLSSSPTLQPTQRRHCCRPGHTNKQPAERCSVIGRAFLILHVIPFSPRCPSGCLAALLVDWLVGWPQSVSGPLCRICMVGLCREVEGDEPLLLLLLLFSHIPVCVVEMRKQTHRRPTHYLLTSVRLAMVFFPPPPPITCAREDEVTVPSTLLQQAFGLWMDGWGWDAAQVGRRMTLSLQKSQPNGTELHRRLFALSPTRV